MRDIIIVVGPENEGDLNTARALVENIHVNKCWVYYSKDFEGKAFREYQEMVEGRKTALILVVGFDRVDFLNKLKGNKKDYIVFVTDQWHYNMITLPIDHIIMPNNVVGTYVKGLLQEKFKCTFPFAMPSKIPTLEELENLYNKIFIDKGLPPPPPLPLPLSDDHTCFPVIFQNRSGTGVFNSQDINEIMFHYTKLGSTIGNANGINYLINNWGKSGISCFLYPCNFMLDDEENRQIKLLLVYAANRLGSKVLVPADSVSFLAELTCLLLPEQITVYKTSSTNASHEKIVGEALTEGYISSYLVGRKTTFSENMKQVYRTNDIDVVVEDILRFHEESKTVNEQRSLGGF